MKGKKRKNPWKCLIFKGFWRRVWDSNPRGVWAPNGFQDRLVMTASITLRVCYLIVFFLAFRILDRDHFGQVFYRLKNGVFWTSFGVLHLASSRGRLKFQDSLVMTASICLRRLLNCPKQSPNQFKMGSKTFGNCEKPARNLRENCEKPARNLRENCEKRFSQRADKPTKNPIKSRVFTILQWQ